MYYLSLNLCCVVPGRHTYAIKCRGKGFAISQVHGGRLIKSTPERKACMHQLVASLHRSTNFKKWNVLVRPMDAHNVIT